MSVAKSYENLQILEGPYDRSKRGYVKVAYPCCKRKGCQKCHGEGFYAKEVRWYYDGSKESFDARYVFGFREAGYITLLVNRHDILDDWFRHVKPRQGRYNLLFQWYIPSYLPMPELPEGTKTIVLKWLDVSENNQFLPYDSVREVVRRITK